MDKTIIDVSKVTHFDLRDAGVIVHFLGGTSVQLSDDDAEALLDAVQRIDNG